MEKYEKKFWDILGNLFVGAETRGESGFANLMRAKFTYFEKVKVELITQINQACKQNSNFKEELYNKLYSFFHRYFNESGSIYYNYTPLFYNIYTQAYQSDTPFTDFEQVISDKQDVYLFYKTKMLYYVKSDKIYKDLEIEHRGGGQELKIKFDTSELGVKKGNEKAYLAYEVLSADSPKFTLKVFYSKRKKSLDPLFKEIKKHIPHIGEEDVKKWFQIFEKQSNIDYFINKNAKKFLSEQLNLWVYQYMFSQEVEFNQNRIQEIQDFKNIANQIIHFISQFEDELAKIWNKPRFVLNSNLVVTLDKLQEKGFDISKLTSHPNYSLQQQEWEVLKIPQENNLIENPYLPIDTKYFLDLKEEIENLFGENEFDGLLIKSENYQALNTLLPRFKDKIDLIYIDPPFNTGSDFAYIDKFQDSTWLSLMENRLELAKPLLSDRGSLYLHLDHNADYRGRELLNDIFGKENFRNEIVWHFRTYQGQVRNHYPRKHNNIFWYKKNCDDRSFFNIQYSDNYQITEDYGRWNSYLVNGNEIRFPHYPTTDSRFDGYLERFIKTNGRSPQDGDLIHTINGYVIDDVWLDIQAIDPKNQTEKIAGALTQKPEALLQRIIQASSNEDSLVLDYHLGSGTTIATAQKLGRKWIGIEMGEHFYEVVIPRMKKVLGGFECGISKEVEYRGGGVFKYYELEQYEQILQKIKASPTPQDFLDNNKIDEIKDCFLFDKKLSEVISEEAQGFKVDISKLYENIDLKESIHNLIGKRPLEITDTQVRFQDCEMKLLEVLKPLLVW